jgi:gliding motility-associated-like protein
MKTYCRLIVLVLLSYLSITGAQAQLKAGTEGLYIKAGTTLSSDGLVLNPSADLTLSDLSLEKSATPVTGNAGSGINSVYNFSTPLTFSGILGIYYLAGELNGNAESLLQLAYKSSGTSSSYTVATGTSANISTKYLENTFNTTTFSTLSAADPAIFAVSANADLSVLTLSRGSLSPTFASGTIGYTASVANNVSSLTVTPIQDEANATITVNGTAVSSGSASGSITLNPGSNTLTTVVTAQDGTTTKTYTVTVTRATPLIVTSSSMSAFTSCEGTATAPQSFTISGSELSNDITVTVPDNNFEVSTSVGGTYSNSITLSQSSGTVGSTSVYVRLTSIGTGTSSGNIIATSVDATTQNVPVTATINPMPSKPTITPGGPTTFCAGGSVTLASSSATGNQWYLDGNPVGGANNQTYTATASGNYTVLLTSSGCDSPPSAAATITVNPVPVITLGTITPVSMIATSFNIPFSGASGDRYSIASGSGTVMSGFAPVTDVSLSGSSLSVSIPASAANTYNFIFTIKKSNGCATDYPFSLIINAPAISASNALTVMSTTYGKASTSQSFTVSGTDMTTNVQATAPSGFEISSDNINFSGTASIGAAGNFVSAPVYIRLSATAAAGTYSGNVVLASSNATSVTIAAISSVIGKKAITISASAKSKTYGDSDPAFTYSVSTGALVGPDAFTGSLTRDAGEAFGTYAINQGTLALSSDYSLTYTSTSLEITKASLTITADSKTRVQGTSNPALTVSYNGFVNGDNNNVLSQQPVSTTSAVKASPAGNYPILISGAVAANYTVAYVDGIFTVTAGSLTAIILAEATLFENQAAGTPAGNLSSTSDDPEATFTYSLVSGVGDTDNGSFTIAGNEIRTTASLNYEQKAVYSIRVRSATPYGSSLDKQLNINLNDVNEIPAIASVANQTICYTASQQTVPLTGISAGPETSQTVNLSVSSSNSSLFDVLTVNQSSGGNSELRYRLKNAGSGTAVVTITASDNGGTANGGVNTLSRSFTITVNPLPQITITSNKGSELAKGDIIQLTATGGSSYSWSNSGGVISGQQTAVVTARPSQTTTYKVSVTTATGCVSEQEITITVKEDLNFVKGTNILTPNGDGVNDKFIIENIDMYPANEVKIFDRTGRLLYSKQNYANEWEGTLNNLPLAEGTYYYIVYLGPGKMKLKGFITLIRD